MKEGERSKNMLRFFMSQKAGAFWSPEPEQHIDEDRSTTSVVI